MSKNSLTSRETEIARRITPLVSMMDMDTLIVIDGKTLHIFSRHPADPPKIQEAIKKGFYLTAEEVLEDS